ncbi:MAG: hypothetical protein IT307_07925 [Chloroflexi bacterium]|nr:hypothetical protein [Chloroflexota bacterium]
MKVELVAASLTEVPTPLLVVNLFEGVTTPSGATGAVDRALDGLIGQLIAEGEIRGELGRVSVIHTRGRPGLRADRVLIVGLGRPAEFRPESARVAAAAVARQARDLRVGSLATIVHGAGIGGLDPVAAAGAAVEESCWPTMSVAPIEALRSSGLPASSGWRWWTRTAASWR